MSYIALYRKYRPVDFDSVVGQDHIKTTLTNQIKENRIGHAYLFTGTRGTGKTSVAKIFSRAINCLTPKNGSPCGECPACKALLTPSNMDVIEIDAASNNGVNEIRDLREKVTYPPVEVRYKVYIIDEVHMLTGPAFNALLKTLEEPPKHAVFILATTEVHKIPQTILSRCMRFDFKLIDVKEIATLIAKIFDDIGKEYDKEAVMAIAKAGEGSVRDALSIADTCVSYSNRKLEYKDVLDVLGASDNSKLLELVKNILAGNSSKIFDLIDQMAKQGKAMSLLCKDIISVTRDLLVIKTSKDANAILNLPSDKFEEMKEISALATETFMVKVLELFSFCESDLRYSTNPRVLVETTALRAGLPQNNYDVDSLLLRVSKLEEQLKKGVFVANGSANINGATPVSTEQVVEEKVEEKKFFKKKLSTITSQEATAMIISGLRKSERYMLWAKLQSAKILIEGESLVITVSTESDYEIVNMEESLKAIREELNEFDEFEIKVISLSKEPTNKVLDEIGEMKSKFGEDTVIIKK